MKGADHLETLARCDVGVFDKTGTITSGKFEFVRCECVHCHCIDKHNHRELLRIIAACRAVVYPPHCQVHLPGLWPVCPMTAW